MSTTGQDLTVFNYVLDWQREERAKYQPEKWDYDVDDSVYTKEFAEYGVTYGFDKGHWVSQFGMYLHRAFVLGLETPGGRQSVAKFVATAIAFLESVVRVHGELPEPGVTSGDNTDKLMPLK